MDELGGLDRAVEMIRERAKLSSGDKINLVAYPGQRSILDLLFDRDGDFETRLSNLIAGFVRFHEMIYAEPYNSNIGEYVA